MNRRLWAYRMALLLAAMVAVIPAIRSISDVRTWLIASALIVVYAFPVAVVRSAGHGLMLLDGPVIFTALMVAPSDAVVVGVCIGSGVGITLLQSAPQKPILRATMQAALMAVSVALAAVVLRDGGDPTSLSMGELAIRGSAAGFVHLLVSTSLAVASIRVLGARVGRFRSAVLPSMLVAAPVLAISTAAAIAQRETKLALVALAALVAAAIVASRFAARLHARRETDAGTSLANRRALDKALRIAHQRLEIHGEPHAAIVVQIESSADDVLTEVARRVDARCGDHDVVARAAIDRLCVLVAAAQADDARALAEELLGVCMAITMVSIGFAAALPGHRDRWAVVSAAESAARHARSAGGGRVRGTASAQPGSVLSIAHAIATDVDRHR